MSEKYSALEVWKMAWQHVRLERYEEFIRMRDTYPPDINPSDLYYDPDPESGLYVGADLSALLQLKAIREMLDQWKADEKELWEQYAMMRVNAIRCYYPLMYNSLGDRNPSIDYPTKWHNLKAALSRKKTNR